MIKHKENREFTATDNFLLQVIAAEGEQKASRALREASEVIAESSAALQLRYLQVKGGERGQGKR